jgi:transposase
MEATSFYAWHLALYLSGAPELKPFNPQVFLFNPKTIKAFKSSFKDLPKNDWTDAWVIANRVRFGQLPKPFSPDERYLPLQRLTRYRYHLVQQLTREKNYFLSYLFLKCSRLAQACPLSSPLGTTAAALVTEYYSVEEIAAAPLEDLAQFLVKKSRNKIADPFTVAREFQKAARHSYRLPDKLKDPINRILASTLQNIRHLQKQIKEIEKAIQQEMAGLDNPLLTIPGMGLVFTAGIIAEIGNIHNFPDDDAVASFAGLTWRQHQSGDFNAEETPLSKTGNIYLRYYLIEAANSVRMHDAEFKRFYEKKYQEAKKHQHKRACVLTARKLVRLIFALLRDNRAYSRPEIGVNVG